MKRSFVQSMCRVMGRWPMVDMEYQGRYVHIHPIYVFLHLTMRHSDNKAVPEGAAHTIGIEEGADATLGPRNKGT